MGKGRGSCFQLRLGLFWILCCIWPFFAQADLCDYYKKFSPKIYEINCVQGPGKAKKSVGSGATTFGGAFNINPSSVPTEPSPYGLEVIENVIPPLFSNNRVNFSLIKGFHKIGSAVTTNSNNTFYGNDVIQRAYGHSTYKTFDLPEPAKGTLPSFNLGTAFELIKSKSIFSPSFSLGVSLRYNQITDTVGEGLGFLVKTDYLVFGSGIVSEKVSNFLPAMDFYSVTVGLRLILLEIEYTWLKNSGGVTLDPIQILTFTTNLGSLILTFAVRRLEFLQEGEVQQYHYAVQYQFSRHLSLGCLYNYVPGAGSVAMQVFL